MGYSDKEQLTALMLALFLGYFGAGRFYINNPFYGTCKLIFTFVIYLLVCAVVRDIDRFVKAEMARYDEESGLDDCQTVLLGICHFVVATRLVYGCIGFWIE